MRRTANWRVTSNSIAEMAATTRPRARATARPPSAWGMAMSTICLVAMGTSAPRSPAGRAHDQNPQQVPAQVPQAVLQQVPRPEWPIRERGVEGVAESRQIRGRLPVTFCLVPSDGIHERVGGGASLEQRYRALVFATNPSRGPLS